MVTENRTEGASLIIVEPAETMQQRLVQLNKLRKSRQFCDVALKISGTEIYAHRSVLACASPYFFELFTADDDQQAVREEKLVYKLNGEFDRESVESLIDYAYTGVLEIPPPKIKHLYLASSMLKMETVSKACGEHIIANLTPETCLAIRTIPGIHSDVELVKRIDEFIQHCQDELMEMTQDAIGLPKIQLKVIHTSKDEAAITNRALSNLALEWVKKQMEEENVMLDSLREKKHLLYLDPDNSLHDCIDIQSGSHNDTEIVQDYKKISKKLSHPNIKVRRKSAAAQPIKPRMMLYSRNISNNDEEFQDKDWKVISHSEVGGSHVAVVTLNGEVCILSIKQHINPPSPTATPHASRPTSVEKVDSYTLIPSMSSQKCASGTGNLNGKLLVCGGYDRGECLKEVEAYNPETNKWELLSEMHHSRGRFDLTILDGRAYAVGGCDGAKELSTVEVYDEKTCRWSYVSPLPLARANTGVCSMNGKVYCIGGWNGQLGIRQCDVYSPDDDTWTTIASLNVGRYQAGAAAFNDQLYAVGGCDSWHCLNSVEMYDPELDEWQFTTPMTTPRRGCGTAFFMGKLYVMGGSDGTQSLCTTEIYDPDTRAWSSGPPMTSCRANVSAAAVGEKLYAVGGFSGKNFLNTVEYLDPSTNEWTNFTPKPGRLPPIESVGENGHDSSDDLESENTNGTCLDVSEDLDNGTSLELEGDSNY